MRLVMGPTHSCVRSFVRLARSLYALVRSFPSTASFALQASKGADGVLCVRVFSSPRAVRVWCVIIARVLPGSTVQSSCGFCCCANLCAGDNRYRYKERVASDDFCCCWSTESARADKTPRSVLKRGAQVNSVPYIRLIRRSTTRSRTHALRELRAKRYDCNNKKGRAIAYNKCVCLFCVFGRRSFFHPGSGAAFGCFWCFALPITLSSQFCVCVSRNKVKQNLYPPTAQTAKTLTRTPIRVAQTRACVAVFNSGLVALWPTAASCVCCGCEKSCTLEVYTSVCVCVLRPPPREQRVPIRAFGRT